MIQAGLKQEKFSLISLQRKTGESFSGGLFLTQGVFYFKVFTCTRRTNSWRTNIIEDQLLVGAAANWSVRFIRWGEQRGPIIVLLAHNWPITVHVEYTFSVFTLLHMIINTSKPHTCSASVAMAAAPCHSLCTVARRWHHFLQEAERRREHETGRGGVTTGSDP